MGRARRWAFVGAGAVTSALLSFTTAWACVSGPAINLSATEVKAGQEVGVKGASFRILDDVQVRWNAMDGPLLTTAKIAGGGFEATFTVPPGTKAGSYVIIATQTDVNGKLSQAPIRAALSVVGDGGTAPVVGASPAVDQRTPGLVRSDQSISGGTLVLIALGAGGIALFLAGLATLAAGRRRPAPGTARVSAK